MFASLAIGAALVAAGASAASDFGALAAGYGSLVIAAALFLGAGLAIRGRIGRAIPIRRSYVQSSPKTVMGHRVF